MVTSKKKEKESPMKIVPQLPQIPDSERTPAVDKLLDFAQQLLDFIQPLLEEVRELRQENQQLKQENLQLKQENQLLKNDIVMLKNEIAILKGQKPRPTIPPNKLDKKSPIDSGEVDNKKRPGSEKRNKTAALIIHEEICIPVENVPQGSIRKGYNEFVVQDIKIESHNTRYLLERWETPDGKYLVAKLPEKLSNSHFGPELIRYILYLYYQSLVTQPLIYEQLLELGVDISTGQLDVILTQNKDIFHDEKDKILEAGLRHSKEILVDDTPARHNGENGFCTQIGSKWFTWFKSTDTKSRINFFELLRGVATDYLINEDAIAYMKGHGISETLIQRFTLEVNKSFPTQKKWDLFLFNECNIGEHAWRTITEAALFASIIAHGIPKDLVVHSDDAPQFDVFVHGLCWIHAERHFRKLIPIDDKMRKKIDDIRNSIWILYRGLEAYQKNQCDKAKLLLEKEFEKLVSQETEYLAINKILKTFKKNKAELLLVLERPYVSLHNNDSEREIREMVKRRKISSGTRSELGRQSRDTFTSLKKTCRKLGVSFWQFLLDRITNRGLILKLYDIIIQKATSPPSPTPESS